MDTVIFIVSWLLLAAIFIVVELISLGLTSIWFAGGAFAASLVALGGGPLPVQVIVFIVVSAVLLGFTRPWARKHLDQGMEKTNVEALIGEKALVIEEINNVLGTGRTKINGMEWTTRTKNSDETIEEGARVTIVDIQGVKLIVEREVIDIDEVVKPV